MKAKTIDDAKKQWCPSSIACEYTDRGSSNRLPPLTGAIGVRISNTCKCLATGCGTWVELEKDMGFCGLARC